MLFKTQSCLNYLKKYKIKFKDIVYTNNLCEFYKKDYLNYDHYIVNGEGTLNDSNNGKGEYLYNIIKTLIDNKKIVFLINCSIDFKKNKLEVLSKCTLIGVREQNTFKKLKKISKLNNIILTGDLIFNKYIEEELFNYIKPNIGLTKDILFFDTSSLLIRKIFEKAKKEKIEYRNLMITPSIELFKINPIKYFKYQVFSKIVQFFPFIGKITIQSFLRIGTKLKVLIIYLN